MVSVDDEADVVVGIGIPTGTLLVYGLRLGAAVSLWGLELSTSAEVESHM
jgi:hypothetical protein